MTRTRTTLALLLAAVVAVAAIGASASASTASRTAGDKNIVETAVAAGQFTALASLVTKAGLVDTLATGGPFTVFAPTDAAFAKVPKATLDALAANPAQLKSVLLYHVVSGRVSAADVVKLNTAKTLDGRSVAIKAVGGGVFVDQARVTTADVEASNGVIHVIDSVLIPKAAAPPKNIVQTAVAAGQFKTLAALLTKAGLAGTLQGAGPFTGFAPTHPAVPEAARAAVAPLHHNRA